MKFLTMAMALMFSFASFAGVIKNSVSQAMLDRVNVGNGAAYIKSYDTKRFDVNKQVITVKQWNSESGCSSWSTSSNVEMAVSKLHEAGAVELAVVLENLRLKNQIKAAIYNTAAPSYDAENCSFNYYEFYSVDGDLLILDLDFNA